MPKLNDSPESRMPDGDGTEAEENRQLTNHLIANAHRAQAGERPTAPADVKTTVVEFLLVIMFVPALWIWKLTSGLADSDERYY